ncbi:MAG TPA: DUF4159 domain-containing protein [Bryobacteraceae bacterium]|jgi:hypothetical protein|nr:DUF4159 domain-containing protein [Bryobacteraceae bacterium]
MSYRKLFRAAASLAACFSAAFAFNLPFREYPGQEYSNFPLPPDYQEKTEFVFARLMYPDGFGRFFGFRRSMDWHQGYTNWTNDYPRADRHLAVAIRRLTRIHVRSVEQPVSLDDGEEYLDRGGFLICDDIWGDSEWESFLETMVRVLPNRPVVDLENEDPAFHTVYDLDHRYQISGQWSLRSGIPYLNGGVVPHWRGIYDERKRLKVAVWVNNDTGDSWEWADAPEYPERYSALGIRVVLNHIVYAMTH